MTPPPPPLRPLLLFLAMVRQAGGRASLDGLQPRIDAGRSGGNVRAAALGRGVEAEADALVGVQPRDLLRDARDRVLFRSGEGACVCAPGFVFLCVLCVCVCVTLLCVRW